MSRSSTGPAGGSASPPQGRSSGETSCLRWRRWTRLTAAFLARYPACEIRLQEVETFDAYRPLRRGDIDVAQTLNEILSLVARGRIVHPTSSTIPVFNRDDVVLIPIADLPPLPLGLVWCAGRENPRIRALNEVAGSVS